MPAELSTVLVEKPATESFGRTMNELRTWLDHHNIQPVEFRPRPTLDGFIFELGFRTEKEAELFKQFHTYVNAAAK